jgi:hypothetical protein
VLFGLDGVVVLEFADGGSQVGGRAEGPSRLLVDDDLGGPGGGEMPAAFLLVHFKIHLKA